MRLRLPAAPDLAALLRWCRDLGAFVRYTAGRFWYDKCTEAASALTYTTLLSLVPLTTITLGILSAFPAFREIENQASQLIFSSLVPQVGEIVREHLEGFTGQAGQLTGFGIIGLMITSVMLLSTIETAFNDIWRVRESRSLLLRLLSSWAILTMTPPLFAASLSFTTQIFASADIETQFPLWRRVAGSLPGLFEFIGFTLLYRVIPNRTVRSRDALTGAAVAALLFELSKTGFVLYLTAFPSYQTIYGALATIPIFLVWLWLAWSIVLLGALIAAALPDWRGATLIGRSIDNLPAAQRLTICCAVLHELAVASRLGTAVGRRTLYARLGIGSSLVEGALDTLRQSRFIERTADDRWLLSRDLGTATLYDLAKALGLTVRAAVDGQSVPIGSGEALWQSRLSDLLAQVDQSQREVLCLTLAALLSDQPDPPAAEGADAAAPGQVGAKSGEAVAVTPLKREQRR